MAASSEAPLAATGGEKGVVDAIADTLHASSSSDQASDEKPPHQKPLSDPAHVGDDSTNDLSEEDAEHLTGIPLAILILGLCLATFFIALDNTILATAIPVITRALNSLDDAGWYGSAYQLTTTVLQPTFGKIFTLFNVKWTYVTAVIIFEIGSIICAVAPSSTVLIVGRAIAGIGGAALYTGGMNILARVTPMSKRPLYLGIIVSMFGIAQVVGPVLGGALTDRLSWRWCFWINLPFGGVVLLTVIFFARIPPRKDSDLTWKMKLKQLDLIGATLLIGALVSLLLALQWGGISYPWRRSVVWGCLLGFALITPLFVAWQLYMKDSATIPPRIISRKVVVCNVLFTSVFNAGIFSRLYYLPYYFQAVKGYSAQGSGVRTLPYVIATTLAAIFFGGVVSKIGWYTPVMWWSCCFFMIACGLLSTLEVDSSAGKWIGYQILAGIGSGSAYQAPFIAVQGAMEMKDVPVGNAVIGTFNAMGAAIGLSIGQNIFINVLKDQLARAPQVDAAEIIRAGASDIARFVSPANLGVVLSAYNDAVTRTFFLGVVAAGVALISVLPLGMKSVLPEKKAASEVGE
ncbi:MAG: hypothetical protein Q9207_005687 [Kuettlingeria erythrocarpa]